MQPAPEQRAGDNVVARIQSHGQGAGPPTPEAVERRAREIATIEGRAPDAVTEDDRAHASRELHDRAPALSADEKRPAVVASSNSADMAVETGHEVENLPRADEQQITEIEVTEGMREAEHERMFEGQKHNEKANQ